MLLCGWELCPDNTAQWGSGNAPFGTAIEALIGTVVALQTDDATVRAACALVQPVTIGIYAILGVLLVDLDFVAAGDFVSVLPSCNFKLQEGEVGLVVVMSELCMSKFMEQGPYAMLCVGLVRCVGDRALSWRPAKDGAGFKSDVGVCALELRQQVGDTVHVAGRRLCSR